MESSLELGDLIDFVNEADTSTTDARELSEKCRDYYDSKQLTDSEVKALKKRKQAPVVVNRIKPKIDGLMGMERSNRTTAKAYPRTPQHEKAATAATEAIRFVLDDQFYRQIRSAAWNNLCVEGTGGVEVIVKPKGKDFCIYLNHIPWDRIIYDPRSRKPDFTDARYKGQVVWLDYDVAIERFPEGKEVLEALQTGSSTYDDRPRWVDSKRKRVKIVELYYLEGGDQKYACFTLGGFLKGPQVSPYKNEDGETEDPYEYASLFVDREGNRYGSVLQYLDVQDEINKRRSKALHLMSVRQVMGERGAVEDVNKAREELARPDGYVEVTPGMVFEVLKTGDMAQAQFKLLEEAKMEIDAVGYNAAASGKEEKSMSGVALKNRELAAQTELAPMFDCLKHLDIRVYRKIWNRIRQYWKAEKWIRVTDDPANLAWVGLNAPDPDTGQIVNAVAELDVDIILDDAPDSVTMQQEEFTALAEMVKSGIPLPPTAIVEASSLKNKDRILQEMRQGMAIPPELKEHIQKLEEENLKLKAGEREAMAKLQVEAQEGQQKLALEAQQGQQKMQMEGQMKQAEMQQAQQEMAMERQLQQEKAALEREKMQLEREKAEAEIAVKLMQAEADAKIAKMGADLDREKAAGEMQLKSQEMEFEQDARMQELMPDSQFKEFYAKKVAGQSLDPMMKHMEQMAEGIKMMVEEVKKLAASNSENADKIVAELKKPRKVSVSGVQRGSDGMIEGATVSTRTLQ